MHIVFYGQETASKRSESVIERRVALLSNHFAQAGHSVDVINTDNSSDVLAHRGVGVRQLPILRGALSIIRTQPNVVHVHRWLPATIIRLVVPILRYSTLVLTVDEIPQGRFAKRIAAVIAAGFDQVTSPSREVQYQLLTELGIRATYIPEGYEEDELPLVPASRWRLQPEKYVVLLGDSAKGIRAAAKAVRTANRKIRIVILQEEKALFKRIKRDIRSVSLVGELQGRQRRSLCAQAALVILADNTTPSHEVLQLMAAGRPVVAVTETRYQELLGITGKVYKSNKVSYLQTVCDELIPNRRKQLALGRAAAIRAERHFSLERVATEYRLAYQPGRTPVLIDSVRPFAASASTSR